jgi:hypothetical protein
LEAPPDDDRCEQVFVLLVVNQGPSHRAGPLLSAAALAFWHDLARRRRVRGVVGERVGLGVRPSDAAPRERRWEQPAPRFIAVRRREREDSPRPSALRLGTVSCLRRSRWARVSAATLATGYATLRDIRSTHRDGGRVRALRQLGDRQLTS